MVILVEGGVFFVGFKPAVVKAIKTKLTLYYLKGLVWSCVWAKRNDRGCPAQFGGINARVVHCVITDEAGNCGNCPVCFGGGYIHQGDCANFSEVTFTPAGGDGPFVCVRDGTPILGGGTVLHSGVSLMTCSLNPAIHYVVGASP